MRRTGIVHSDVHLPREGAPSVPVVRLAVAACVLLVLTACGAGRAADNVEQALQTPDPTAAAERSDYGTTGPSGPTTKALGDGITLTVSAPTSFTPTDTAYPRADRAVAFAMEVENKSGTIYRPAQLSFVATADGVGIDQVIDSTQGYTGVVGAIDEVAAEPDAAVRGRVRRPAGAVRGAGGGPAAVVRRERDPDLRRHGLTLSVPPDNVPAMSDQKRLAEGDAAPDFRLPDSNGDEVALSDFRGKHVVVYFYPSAGTPGCTKQACDFRDNLAELNDAGLHRPRHLPGQAGEARQVRRRRGAHVPAAVRRDARGAHRVGRVRREAELRPHDHGRHPLDVRRRPGRGRSRRPCTTCARPVT